MQFLPCDEIFAFGKATAMANADEKSDEKQRGENAGRRKKYEPQPIVGREGIATDQAHHRNQREPHRRDQKHAKQIRRLQRRPKQVAAAVSQYATAVDHRLPFHAGNLIATAILK